MQNFEMPAMLPDFDIAPLKDEEEVEEKKIECPSWYTNLPAKNQKFIENYICNRAVYGTKLVNNLRYLTAAQNVKEINDFIRLILQKQKNLTLDDIQGTWCDEVKNVFIVTGKICETFFNGVRKEEQIRELSECFVFCGYNLSKYEKTIIWRKADNKTMVWKPKTKLTLDSLQGSWCYGNIKYIVNGKKIKIFPDDMKPFEKEIYDEGDHYAVNGSKLSKDQNKIIWEDDLHGKKMEWIRKTLTLASLQGNWSDGDTKYNINGNKCQILSKSSHEKNKELIIREMDDYFEFGEYIDQLKLTKYQTKIIWKSVLNPDHSVEWKSTKHQSQPKRRSYFDNYWFDFISIFVIVFLAYVLKRMLF